MRFGSVCSGIEAASVAWHPLGWRAAFLSEIEPFPCAVLAHHYPDVPNRGDMTKFKEWPDAAIDVLCGGTPCQSFSTAGLRKGLDDPRGNLMLTFGAVAARYRPRWLVWENVPGVLSSNAGRDFGAFLGLLGFLGYGFAYRVLDAQYVRVDGYARAVPQRRNRVFVVGCLGDWRSAAAVLLERESLRGDPAPRRSSGQATPGALGARSNLSVGAQDAAAGHLIAIQGNMLGRAVTAGPAGSGISEEGISFTLTKTDVHAVAYGGNNCAGPVSVSSALSAHGGRMDFESETFIAHTLRGEGFDASEDGTGRGTPLVPHVVGPLACNTGPNGHDAGNFACNQAVDAGHVLPVAFGWQNAAAQGMAVDTISPTLDKSKHPATATATAVRRLTPRECERLMGFPDDYTRIPLRNAAGKLNGKWSKDGPRYKALGNSWAVNCARWIGRRIEMVEQINAARKAAA